jgi:DNA (cytosine-5)-methyltransferase 1
MLDYVDKLMPETVVIENVLGMKWMQKGQVLRRIVESLEGVGYTCSVVDLKAEEFCVPQRRRRVFVLGTRDNEQIPPPKGILSSIARGKTRKNTRLATMKLPPPVTVSEAISDLPALSEGQGSDRIRYNPKWIKTDYQHLMRGQIDLSDFIENRTRLINEERCELY